MRIPQESRPPSALLGSGPGNYLKDQAVSSVPGSIKLSDGPSGDRKPALGIRTQRRVIYKRLGRHQLSNYVGRVDRLPHRHYGDYLR